MSARDVLATTLAYISPGALLADVILADLTAAGYSIAPPGSRVVPEAADWQPMDTAPKDGSDILVYDRGEIVTVKWADALVRRGNDTVYGWMNPCQFTEAGMSDMTMVERVALVIGRTAYGYVDPVETPNTWNISMHAARATIEAMQEPDDAFLALVAERMHDARFSQSGETYPVLRSFLRAVVDAALSEQQP